MGKKHEVPRRTDERLGRITHGLAQPIWTVLQESEQSRTAKDTESTEPTSADEPKRRRVEGTD